MIAYLLTELTDLGFSPASALAIVGVVALAAVVKYLHAKSTTDREAWHAETRSQLATAISKIEEGEKRHTECEKDRENLHRDLRDVRDRVARFERCPQSGCPMRLPN